MSEQTETSGDAPPPPGRGLRRMVLKGGALLFARQVISMGLSLVGVVMITRIIGPERYGSYAAASGICQYLLSIGAIGIGVYLIRQARDTADRDFHVATTLLLGSSAILVAVIELGTGLLSTWVHVEGFEALLRVLAIAIPFQLLGLPASARLERALDYRSVAIVELSSQLTFYVVALPLVLAGHGPWGLVGGWIAQQMMSCVLYHVLGRYWPNIGWDAAIARRMLTYTLSYSAADWLWQMRTLVNPLIVGHFLGAATVGQVAMCIRLVELLCFFKTIAWRLSVAVLAKIQDQPAKLVEAITQGMQLQTMAIGPIVLGFGWLGGWLLPLLFGEAWLPVMDIYPFIALAYLTNAQFNMHSSALYVLERNWEVSVFHIAHIVLFGTVAAVACSRLGVTGYGWGELAALLGYFVIHRSVARVIGRPGYRVPAVWWTGLAIGLFWRELGPWAFAAPFAALLWPESIGRLRAFWVMLRGGGSVAIGPG